jgi:hypothetical protein
MKNIGKIPRKTLLNGMIGTNIKLNAREITCRFG